MQQARTGRWSDEMERCRRREQVVGRMRSRDAAWGFKGNDALGCTGALWGGLICAPPSTVLTPMLAGLPERAGLTMATLYGLCVGPSFSSSVGEQVITTSGNLTYTHA